MATWAEAEKAGQLIEKVLDDLVTGVKSGAAVIDQAEVDRHIEWCRGGAYRRGVRYTFWVMPSGPNEEGS